MAIKISEKSIKNALIFSYEIPEFIVRNNRFLILKILKKNFFLKKN